MRGVDAIQNAGDQNLHLVDKLDPLEEQLLDELNHTAPCGRESKNPSGKNHC